MFFCTLSNYIPFSTASLYHTYSLHLIVYISEGEITSIWVWMGIWVWKLSMVMQDKEVYLWCEWIGLTVNVVQKWLQIQHGLIYVFPTTYGHGNPAILWPQDKICYYLASHGYKIVRSLSQLYWWHYHSDLSRNKPNHIDMTSLSSIPKVLQAPAVIHPSHAMWVPTIRHKTTTNVRPTKDTLYNQLEFYQLNNALFSQIFYNELM